LSGVVVVKLLVGLAALLTADRLLLWMERRGWVYYRNSKGAGRGAVGYHMLEMSSVFDPSQKVVQEIQVMEQKQIDDSGDPLGSQSGGDEPEADRAVDLVDSTELTR
jgi:hypothetical protein